jgi:Rap1a immunity proteins
MRIPALMVAAVLFAGSVAPAIFSQTPTFREPTNVGDVLDACGEAVSELDSPPTQTSAANTLKLGWCLGWVQGLFEHIVEVHTQTRFEEMIAKKDGKPAPPPGLADKVYMSICLPPETRVPDLMRVIVKGLRGVPMQLHEPKNGPVKEVLKKAYPCPASNLEEAKPADSKP